MVVWRTRVLFFKEGVQHFRKESINVSLEFDCANTAPISQVKRDDKGVNMGLLSINNGSYHVGDQALNVKDVDLVSFPNVTATKNDVDSLLSLPFSLGFELQKISPENAIVNDENKFGGVDYQEKKERKFSRWW